MVFFGGKYEQRGIMRDGFLAGKVRYVVDGDSLYIAGHKAQIRLWVINCP